MVEAWFIYCISAIVVRMGQLTVGIPWPPVGASIGYGYLSEHIKDLARAFIQPLASRGKEFGSMTVRVTKVAGLSERPECFFIVC
jgi:hypothetical protein